MNEEVLDLVTRYPDLLNKLSDNYRSEILMLDYQRSLPDGPRYAQVAYIYNRAYTDKLSNVSKVIQAVLGLKEDNAHMMVQYAKRKGLITVSFKTNHDKGYRQKNYVPKSEGIK